MGPNRSMEVMDKTINLYGFSVLLMLLYDKFELATSSGFFRMYPGFLRKISCLTMQ